MAQYLGHHEGVKDRAVFFGPDLWDEEEEEGEEEEDDDEQSDRDGRRGRGGVHVCV